MRKEEWMIHVWGGLFNDGVKPSITDDHGITEGYYYFSTDKEKDAFLELITTPKYKKHGCACTVKHGVMSHKRTIFVGTFRYQNKDYVLHYDFGYEETEELAEYMFICDDYSCDCNRSDFIRREYGCDLFPDLGCGAEIELIDYHFEYWD